MFNVTVLKMRDIFKVIIGITFLVVVVLGISKIFHKDTKENSKGVQKIENGIKALSQFSMINCMDQTIPTMSSINEEYKNIAKEDDQKEDKNILQEMLKTQISSVNAIKESEEITNKENNENIQENEKNQTEEKQEIQLAQEGLQTQVITQNPISENSNVTYKNVKIKNQTSYTLTEEMLNPDITIENKNIILFHTHSCESYTSSDKYPYTPTGTFRTTDLNFTVVRVGTELENQLKQYQYNVIHNTDYHDYPSYNGSYTRSLATVENILKTNPSDIIIDVHRDAVGSRSDYAPTVKIGDTDEAAQIMFVIRNK
ncbi:MAG: stage II sporulation protein P [Clostridia bacterium]|jgi:stage II sporulation P family protein|nr:stage II sporulation protein P [Clostridia bacterium]